MKKNGPRGIIGTMVTPFTADEKLDEIAFRKQVKYLLSVGVHGLSTGGTTGEGSVVTDHELAKMVEICKEETPDGFPIVAGIIRDSTRAAVSAGLAAKSAGATALLVQPVHYQPLVPDEKGTFDYFNTVSKKVQLPIIIYNGVQYNGISAGLFKQLLEIEYMVGIKQCLGELQGLYDMIMTNGDVGLIYTAVDDAICPSFEMGADGAITAILSVYAKECVEIWDAVQRGDKKTAWDIQKELYQKWQIMKGLQFPRRLKEALKQMGMDYGLAISPNREATPEEKQNIAAMLA